MALSPEIEALMNSVREKRRAIGLNVKFWNDGRVDEWSFRTAERAERFRERKRREGTLIEEINLGGAS